ncbi:hypothetical protein Tco_0668848 [Tanacetum coccineum]
MVDATHVEQADPTPIAHVKDIYSVIDVLVASKPRMQDVQEINAIHQSFSQANSFSMHAKCLRIGSQRFMEAEACFKEQASQHIRTGCHETKIFLVLPSLLTDSLKEQLPGLLYDSMKYINSLKDSLPGLLSESLKLNLSSLLKENVTTKISKKEKKALCSAMTDIMTTSLMPFNKQFNALNKLDAKRTLDLVSFTKNVVTCNMRVPTDLLSKIVNAKNLTAMPTKPLMACLNWRRTEQVVLGYMPFIGKSSFIYSNEENENLTKTFDVVVLISEPSQVEPQPSGSSSNPDLLALVTVVIPVLEEEEPKPKRLMVVMDLPKPV